MSVQWTEDMSVGVEVIDIQHKVLVDVINELNQAIKDDKTESLIPIILEKLQGFAKFHFRTEEGYFIRFSYEDADAHVAEHQRLTGKVEDFINRYKSDSKVSVGELVFFLGDWLENHLKEMDQLYVPCFLKHGLM